MWPKFRRIVLVDSAYRHGFGGHHVREVLQHRPLILRSRRGVKDSYEVFGQTYGGEYLHIVGRVIEAEELKTFRVYHVGQMHDRDRRRYLRWRG